MGAPFGNYVLERWVAQGGMANIFLATYSGALGFEREVALKVILPEYAHHPDFVTMFLDEGRLAARLNHPNIVQVHDLGQVIGYTFIAMEYVAGDSLSRALTRGNREGLPFSVGLSLFVVGELLEALQYAHQRRDRNGLNLGIVHRDVNPQNILVSFDGQVKLTDFGVARANCNLHQTQAGVVKGKFSYMAPEQCQAKPVDNRADLFSVGIVLYELLTGRSLFHRSTTYEMVRAIMEEPIVPPSQVSSRCPPELDALVLKALERDPGKRFQSAMAFLDALALGARRLQLAEGRYAMRSYFAQICRHEKYSLGGDGQMGIPVTEDRISQILRGLHPVPASTGSGASGLYRYAASRRRGRSAGMSLPTGVTLNQIVESEKTNAWGELLMEDAEGASEDTWKRSAKAHF